MEQKRKRKRNTAKILETKRVCKNNYAKESEKVNALGLNSKNMTK